MDASELTAFRATLASDFEAALARASLLPTSSSAHVPVRRLTSSAPQRFSESLPCLQPALAVRNVVDAALFAEELRFGRKCATCAEQCGVHVMDHVAAASEAAALVRHGELVQASRSAGPVPEQDFAWASTARAGQIDGHLLAVRIAERLRRLSARLFGLPLPRLTLTETFVRRSEARANDAAGYTHAAHCDEAINPQFHYSSVLYLGECGRHFDGGELSFFHNRSWPWLLVEPAVGRAVFYSSGWENVHRVKRVERGERWTLVAVFAVSAHPDGDGQCPDGGGGSAVEADASAGDAGLARRFSDTCIRPGSRSEFEGCGRLWAQALS